MERLEKMVGSKGSSRAFILARLQSVLQKKDFEEEPVSLGLQHSELELLSERHYFKQLSSDFSTRGDENRMKEIAWFGSVIGDIFCPAYTEDKMSVLREAAVFNVAVALFDTVVDDLSQEKLAILAGAITPSRMVERIEHPMETTFALHSSDQSLNRILKLFDFVLAGLGRRFENDQVKRGYLVELLSVMYRSEVMSGGNKLKAKRLPIVFIGLLSGGSKDAHDIRLINEFSRLLSLLDDWQDLGQDICHRKANGLIYHHDGRGFLILPYATIALFRMVGFYLSYLMMAKSLSRSINNVLKFADGAGLDVDLKTKMLLRSLLIPL